MSAAPGAADERVALRGKAAYSLAAFPFFLVSLPG